jgi:hypothetical protein
MTAKKKPSPPTVCAWEVTNAIEQITRLTITMDVIASAMRSEQTPGAVYRYSTAMESLVDSLRNITLPLEDIAEQAHQKYYQEFETQQENKK